MPTWRKIWIRWTWSGRGGTRSAGGGQRAASPRLSIAFTALGGLALCLAALGLYSVIAYGVAHRRHELGVRMALGARSADIVRLVVGESIRFAVSGLLIGGIVSVAAAHWIAPLLFDESPHDPAVFAVVGAVLIVTSLAASWLPARQAARVDPTTALQAG